MTADQLKTVTDFESGLKVGDEVTVRWTNCRRFYKALSTVDKINDKSILVLLKEGVPVLNGYGDNYPVGHKIKAPLCKWSTMKLWTANNRVEPVNGYQDVVEKQIPFDAIDAGIRQTVTECSKVAPN